MEKDFKKLGKILQLVIAIIFVLGLISYLKGDIFGLRTDIFIKKISYKKYDHLAPNFSFKYPDYYTLDNDPNNLYGENYATGFKLTTDSRAGCDVRMTSTGINFKKSDADIKKALVEDIAKSAKDFELIKAKRIKIGGEDAFSVEFTFTDPLNNKVKINQIMTSSQNNHFLIMCGTGAYQYQYLEKDFEDFIKSFKWKSDMKIGQ